MPKRGRSRSLARKGTSAAAAKRRRFQEDAQQRNRRASLLVLYINPLRLACGAVMTWSETHAKTAINVVKEGRPV